MLIWYPKDKGVSTRLIKGAYDFKIEFCYFKKKMEQRTLQRSKSVVILNPMRELKRKCIP